jgi:hypothetical protein
MALGLVLPSLDQALQLVGVLGQPRLQRLPPLVLFDQLADGLRSLGWEAGHLVGSDFGVGGGHDVRLADRGHVPNSGLLGVVEQAQRRRLSWVGAFHDRQQIPDDGRPERVLSNALRVVDPGDPPAGSLVPLEQPHLVQEVGQALQLGLGHWRGLSHVTTLDQDFRSSRTP